ncbi:MAG: CoA-transferase subunit beta [Anaerolineales bacterium]|nr:CoA-transferase subunit beta [Anaerolineales bacterium]
MNAEIPPYSDTEFMICIAARLMKDGTTAFVGTGIPMLAASLAQRLYTPNLITIFEFGGVGAQIDELPIAVGGSQTFHRAIAALGICESMETAQRGFVDYGFIGGAQIDPYGNLNSTAIGGYLPPKVRLPGSGGGNDVGSLCWTTIAIMRHDKRRFVPKCDFITTPGYLTGPGAREAAGLPRGTGPSNVVSTLALLGFDRANTCRMTLEALCPGVSVQQVIDNTGFELIIPESVPELTPPTPEELRLLREEIDREHLYI